MYHNNTLHISAMNDYKLVTIASIVLIIAFTEEMFDLGLRKLMS